MQNIVTCITRYRDGIAFRTSMQATNKWGDKYAVRLGIMEEVEKNKEFVLRGVMEQFGETKEIWYSDCCIQFKIVEKEEEKHGNENGYKDYMESAWMDERERIVAETGERKP